MLKDYFYSGYHKTHVKVSSCHICVGGKKEDVVLKKETLSLLDSSIGQLGFVVENVDDMVRSYHRIRYRGVENLHLWSGYFIAHDI